MKLMLINPPAKYTLKEFPNEKGDSYLETSDFGNFPPLGLLYIISYIKKYAPKHTVILKDCIAEKLTYSDLKTSIQNEKPDIVGITSFTISMVDVCKTAQLIRDIIPQVHLCLGGHHPIAFPIQAAQLKEFDSIVVGEGEIAFSELVTAIENNSDITQIHGVYTSESITKMINPNINDNRFLSTVVVPPAYIDDIDLLPIPDRSYIQHLEFKSVVGVTNKLATIITSRGCPYKCTFCDVPYKRYRKRSIKSVVDEIETCLHMGYKEIHFYDDLFNITPERVIEFCDEIDSRNLHFPWDFRGRVNTVTFESLRRAKKSGCRMISFGVETGTNEGLTQLQKGTTVEKIKEVFTWCRKLHIKTIADYMIGLPFEKTPEDIMRNVSFLISLDPDYAQFAILCLYPNTRLYNLAIEKGLVPKEKWIEYSLHPTTSIKIDHWEEWMSTDELVQLQKQAYKKFYLRWKYMFRNIFNNYSIYEIKTKIIGFLKLLF